MIKAAPRLIRVNTNANKVVNHIAMLRSDKGDGPVHPQ
jgi:hypothetical protein